ncbi:disulfide bond formation protein B [Sphingobium algorifonticola]|uniref:Disulfide bond formation protein B n=1 Tax=Sphingobium algorifonticola TaxID=2008318 RepID=A0A437J8P8_9SPHN|nr:disulfide bond formation protein B [Sphingobium algorifonticola]RVT41874.1 disulfide bond formation protein B [Sphingobium algorifonticola]
MTPLSTARLIAILAPSALLGGALVSQYVGGLHPCEMCLWQRWPHLAAIVLALLAIILRGRAATSATLTALAALAIAISGAIGAFHAGVEYGWWEGLTACSTMPMGNSAADILDTIMAAPLTRCDVAPWSLFGISLAGYNALLSLAAAVATLGMLSKARRRA